MCANNEVLDNQMIEQIACMRSKANLKLKWGSRHEERKKDRKVTVRDIQKLQFVILQCVIFR